MLYATAHIPAADVFQRMHTPASELEGRKVFILEESYSNHNETVRAALLRRGWVENKKGWSKRWDLKWTWDFSRAKLDARDSRPVNQFPSSHLLSNKDELWELLVSKYGVSGAMLLMPRTFNLSDTASASEFERRASSSPSQFAALSAARWVVKPGRLARGTGVSVVASASQALESARLLNSSSSVVIVQEYVQPPLLLHGHKFDMRVFFLITRWSPVTAYVYSSPYARVAPLPYSSDDMSKLAHVTNRQISKLFEGSDARFGTAWQWNHEQVDDYLRNTGRGEMWSRKLWPGILSLAHAVARALPDVQQPRASFQLFGLDILADDSGGVWLCEVNSGPGLHMITDVVRAIYPSMIDRMFSIVLGDDGPVASRPQGKGRWIQVVRDGDEVQERAGEEL
jgi:tubulin monoglycylase TTLL3/8